MWQKRHHEERSVSLRKNYFIFCSIQTRVLNASHDKNCLHGWLKHCWTSAPHREAMNLSFLWTMWCWLWTVFVGPGHYKDTTSIQHCLVTETSMLPWGDWIFTFPSAISETASLLKNCLYYNLLILYTVIWFVYYKTLHIISQRKPVPFLLYRKSSSKGKLQIIIKFLLDVVCEVLCLNSILL